MKIFRYTNSKRGQGLVETAAIMGILGVVAIFAATVGKGKVVGKHSETATGMTAWTIADGSNFTETTTTNSSKTTTRSGGNFVEADNGSTTNIESSGLTDLSDVVN